MSKYHMMWQDNTLLRITQLEDQMAAQAQALHSLTALVNEIAELVVLQTRLIQEIETDYGTLD